MSYAVTALVRAARLPRSVKRRPEVKAVLFALADRCTDDGRNAWPAVATIAAETEMSARIVQKCLGALAARDLALIEQQAPPGQHRPRTWRLDLARLASLTAPQGVAGLASDAAPQHAAGLTRTAAASAPQDRVSGPQDSGSGPQMSPPAPQHVADDPVLLDPIPLNSHLNGAAASPRQTPKDRHPASDGNVNVKLLAQLVNVLLDETGRSDMADPDLPELIRQRCALEHLNCGNDPAGANDVIHRALALACMQRRMATKRKMAARARWIRVDGR